MVFPWTRRPGSLEKTDYLRWFTFPFLDAMLNMMPVLPRCCATKGDFGMDLHGGAGAGGHRFQGGGRTSLHTTC